MDVDNKIRRLFGEQLPCVAASVSDKSVLSDVASVRARGLDIAELRIDLFDDCGLEHVQNVVRQVGEVIPTIATIRVGAEGGQWSGSEEDRLNLFRGVFSSVDAVDIELSAVDIRDEVIADAKDAGVHVIVSYHNFDETPARDKMCEVVAEAEAVGADIIKIATHVNELGDVKILTELLLQSDKKMVVIGMGDLGKITRLMLPVYGSCITFCSLDSVTGPGQYTFDEMVRLLCEYYPEYAKRVARL